MLLKLETLSCMLPRSSAMNMKYERRDNEFEHSFYTDRIHSQGRHAAAGFLKQHRHVEVRHPTR